MAVSDNLFSFADWAGSESGGLTSDAGGATLAVSGETGTVTITSGSTQHVYTRFGMAGGYYNMPVDPNATYRLALTMAGTSAQSQVYYVPLGANMEQLNQGRWPYVAATPARGAGDVVADFTTPDGCRYVQLFFDVHDVNRRMAFSSIRLYRMHVAERAEGAETYGSLPAPERAGCLFGGWYTAADGGGIRITRYSRATADSLALYAHWVEPAMHFGQAGCSPIDVGPFEPICTRPEIGGSSPLTLNIPVPTYAPVVQPQECVCFEFEKGTANGTVGVTTCGVDGKNAGSTLTVEITPAGDDCCGGKYQITPHLDLTIPCVPFDLPTYEEGATLVNVTNRSRDESKGVDGGVTNLGLVKHCCDVRPTIDITFPDCVKYYDPKALPKTQITYWDLNEKRDALVKKEWTLVEMVADDVHCSLYPKVNPLKLPDCILPDFKESKTQNLGHGGSITVTLERENCVTTLDMSVTPIEVDIPPPAPPCLAPNTVSGSNTTTSMDSPVAVYVRHENKDGTLDAEAVLQDVSSKIKLEVENETATGCPKYKPSIELHLGGVFGGGGVGYGGVVLQDYGGGATSGKGRRNLFIDGTLDEANYTTWYGGGLGNTTSDANPPKVYRRGPLMRVNQEGETGNPMADLAVPFTELYDPSTNAPVPYRLTTADGTQYGNTWYSSRSGTDAHGNPVQSKTPPSEEGAGVGVYGNLDMVLPSGFQWHKRGVAATLSDFIWSQSGVLSTVHETPVSVLLSPAHSAWGDETTVTIGGNSWNLGGLNASGLALDLGSDATGVISGLRVDRGDGLRIFGRDYRTSETEAEAELEAATGDRQPDRFGRLELYAHDGDFAFQRGQSDGRLVLNDTRPGEGETEAPGLVTGMVYPTGKPSYHHPGYGFVMPRTRGSDYTLPVVMADVGPEPGTGSTMKMWEKHVFSGSEAGGDAVYNYRPMALKDKLERISAALEAAADDIAESYDIGVYDLADAIYKGFSEVYLLLQSLRVMNVHVGAAGMVMGADTDQTGANIVRRTDPEPASGP